MRNALYLMPGKQCLANNSRNNTCGNYATVATRSKHETAVRKPMRISESINSLSRMKTIIF
jgi:hypothetical protein